MAFEDGLSEANNRLPAWCAAPQALDLPHGEVHVWLLLDDDLGAASVQHDMLAKDEQTRAARLGDSRFRSYVGTRAALRTLLARYAGLPSGSIEFSYGPHGKPAFEAGGVHFTVSHAADRALLAFSRSFAVGIDLEKVKDHRRFDALTARFFSPANARSIASASKSALPRVFTEAWAQREAYVKAVGGGLYATSDALAFQPGRVPRVRLVDEKKEVWTVATVDAGEAFEGKLVVRGEPVLIHHFSFGAPARDPLA